MSHCESKKLAQTCPSLSLTYLGLGSVVSDLPARPSSLADDPNQASMIKPSPTLNTEDDDDKTNSGALTRRRGAMRQAKVHEHLGHKFLAHYFRSPTYCSFCNEFIW